MLMSMLKVKCWYLPLVFCIAFVTGVLAQPPGPLLSSPTNNAVNVSTSPQLCWTPLTGAAEYRLQVSTITNFSTYIFNQAGITGNCQQVAVLQNCQTYYWHVNAIYASYISGWSVTWSFKTIGGNLSVPVLSSPTCGATNQPISVNMCWTSSAGALYYLQVSTVSTFNPLFWSQSGLTVSCQTIASLANCMTYYWRVWAFNSCDTLVSNPCSFSTRCPSSILDNRVAVKAPVFTFQNGIIAYSLIRTTLVEITVFGLQGQCVFAYHRTQPAGNYIVALSNRSIPPGQYLVRLKAGDLEKRMKVQLPGKR